MLEPIIRKNAFGGKGEVTLRPLLTDEQKNEKIQIYYHGCLSHSLCIVLF